MFELTASTGGRLLHVHANSCLHAPPKRDLSRHSAALTWDVASSELEDEIFVDLEFPGSRSLVFLARDLTLKPVVPGSIVDSSTTAFFRISLPEHGDFDLGIGLHGMIVGRWLSPRVFRAYVQHRGAAPIPHVSAVEQYAQGARKTLTINWAPRSTSAQGWAVPYRLRHGHAAAFCITDHADFDVPEIYNALIGVGRQDGLAASGLKLSKSVFVSRGAGKTSCMATLSDPSWRRLVYGWREHGHIELGLHLTRPLPADRRETLEDLDTIAAEQPKFWIDHGVEIPQAIWNAGGRLGSDHYIWDALLQRGVRVFWNRRDLWDNAPRDELDILSFREAKVRPELVQLLTASGVRSPDTWKAAINRCLDPAIARGARRLWQAGSRAKIGSLPFGVRQLGLGVARSVTKGHRTIMVPEDDRLLSPVYSGELLLESSFPLFFSSQLVREPVATWAPPNVDRLLRNHGLHIAHTYLGEKKRLPLVEGASQYMVSARFRQILEHLGNKVASGDIWAPGIAELAVSLAEAFDTRIQRDEYSDDIVAANVRGDRAFLLIGAGRPTVSCSHSFVNTAGLRVLVVHGGPGENIRLDWPLQDIEMTRVGSVATSIRAV